MTTKYLKQLLPIVILLLFASCSTNPPNFILIMADDLGYGDLGCYGSTDQATPRIDELAAGGIKFLDYHSNGAVCSPTRAALMTGCYQQRTGIEGVVTAANHRVGGLAVDQYTLADMARDQGYVTGLFGKWHLGYDTLHFPVKNGFDEFTGFVSGNVDYITHIDQTGIYDWWESTDSIYEPGYLTDLITEHAVQFIQDHAGHPFLLYVAHGAPHYPYQGRDDKPERAVGDVFSRGGTLDEKIRAYKEMITALDEGVGTIVDEVKRLKLEDNTLVLFCSDNGGVAAVGSNGVLRGQKGTLWEGGHRVPAIAYWPGKIEPSTSSELVLSMDIMPTLASLSGANANAGANWDGIDVSSHLLNEKVIPDRFVYWRFKQFTATRQGQWKYLKHKENEYLFNLSDDIGETNDLSKEFSDTLKYLRNSMEQWEDEMAKYDYFTK